MPRVAMKPCTPRKATITPLASPMPAVTRSASSTPGTTWESEPSITSAPTMQPIVTTYGTERSRLPTRITSVWPIAIRPRVLASTRIASMLPLAKKLRSFTTAVSTAPSTTATSSSR